MFPGLSRSGSTLSVGLLRGINQQTALDYSFVLGIPSIAAAALVSVFDMGDQVGAVGAAPLIAGVITAAVVGFLAIKLLKWIVTTNKLHIFAFYTLIVGALIVVIGIIEHITGTTCLPACPCKGVACWLRLEIGGRSLPAKKSTSSAKKKPASKRTPPASSSRKRSTTSRGGRKPQDAHLTAEAIRQKNQVRAVVLLPAPFCWGAWC